MKLLLCVDEITDNFKNMIDALKPYCEVLVYKTNDKFSLNNIDIFVGKKLSLSCLKTANALKVVFAYKTGVENFPLKEMQKLNIPLVNSHASAKLIGEYVFAVILNLLTHINKYDKDLRQGIWYDKNDIYWESVYNKTIGLLGYGNIGQNVHKILQQNNIKTCTIKYKDVKYKDIKVVNNLTELIENCDVIVCALPQTKQTDNMFNKQTLSLMKNKYLINVGRANVINEEDLFFALNNNQIKGVALDSWNNRPKNKFDKVSPSEYDFSKFNNIIMLPHAATRTMLGQKYYVEDILNKIINYIKNNTLTDVVDLNKGF